MGRAKKNVEVEAQVIARGNVVPMMTETESAETVQYVSDEDAAREDMVRTVFVLPARRERTLFISRLSKAVALANRAIGMSNTK